MLNKSGVTRVKATAPTQILANVGLQHSIGCNEDFSKADYTSVVVTDGALKIVPAGTPVNVDLSKALEKNTTMKLANDTTVAMNGVLLHDVIVNQGAVSNCTVLLFGFVDAIKVTDSKARAALAKAVKNAGASKLITVIGKLEG